MRICRVVCHPQHAVSCTRARVITFLLVCPWMVTYVEWLKWYYDENRIFPIQAILKHKQVVCVRRKMLFTFFKKDIRVFKICKLAPSGDVIHSTKFCSNMMKRDITANLYQKFLIFCSKILLNVLHNMSLTVLLPWHHTGFQTSPIL